MMSREVPTGFESDFAQSACAKCAGHYFARMLESEQFTWNCLNHPDSRARLGALAMIRDYWKPHSGFFSICEKMALEDHDLDVRCLALNCLIPHYYGSKDLRLSRWLARIVLDEDQPTLFRTIAYTMLFAIGGDPRPPLPHTFRFPEQLDLDFVNSFLREAD